MTAASPTRRRWPAVLAWAVASAPIAISAAIAIARQEWQAGDRSIMGVFTHDVFSAHPPLLGTISTLGNYAETGQGHPVHHLGPAQFYALALPDWMVGGHPAGLIIGGMLINVAAVALVIVATRRRTGDAGMAAMAAVSVGLAYGLGPALLRDIWTPYLGLWPLLALLALTWSLIDGDLWALPWAAVVASFLAQIELLFVGPVLVLVAAGVTAVGVRAWRRRDDPDAPGLRRPIVLAAAWSLVIWLPVLVQEVSGNPGNLTLLVQSLGGQGDRAGWGFVGRNLVAQVQLPPIWLVRARTPLDVGDDVSVLDAIGAIAVVASLALLTVRAVARRRTEPTAAALLATVWAALLGGAFNLAITPAEGLIGLQYRRWMWPVGAFLWFALAYATWVEARVGGWVGRLDATRRTRAALAVGALAILAVVPASIGQHTPLPDDLATNEIVGSAWDPMIDRLPRQPTYVAFLGGDAAFAVGPELVRRLIVRGFEVDVPELFADSYGDHRVLDPAAPPPQTVAIVSDEGTLMPPDIPVAVLSAGRIDGGSSEAFAARVGPLLERVRASAPFELDREGRILLEGELASDSSEPAAAADAVLTFPTRTMFDETVLRLQLDGHVTRSPLTDDEARWLLEQLEASRVVTYLLPSPAEAPTG